MKNNIKIHPLEDVFNIEPEIFKNNVTPVYQQEENLIPDTIVDVKSEKDDEDIKIDTQMDEIYSKAINAFEDQMEYVQEIEPRYAARNAEVAAQYLSIALNSRMARAKVKNERKRNNQFIPFNNPKTVNNNLIVADRNHVLKMLLDNEDNKQEI